MYSPSESLLKQFGNLQSTNKTLNLWDLNKKEATEFKDRVKKFNGMVRLLVHPNFADYAKHEVDEDLKKTAENYQKVFERL
jgi:hypothetical protein